MKNLLGNIHQRPTGDGRQDRRTLGGYHLVVLGYKNKVCSTGLLNEGLCCCIEVEVFCKTVLVGFVPCIEAHGVVQSTLDMSGTARCRSVEFTDLKLQRLDSTLEIRTYGSTEHPEGVLGGGSNTDDRAAAEQKRSDIEGGTAAVGRHIGKVGFHQLVQGIDKAVLGKRRHQKPVCRFVHALGIEIGAECYNLSIDGGIGLQAFKTGLCVL